MASEYRRRIRNEQLFFVMNKRIKDLAKRLLNLAKTDEAGLELQMACECSDAACFQKISIDMASFNKIHQETGQYMVAPGHDQHDIESVVARFPNYVVVKKYLKPTTDTP